MMKVHFKCSIHILIFDILRILFGKPRSSQDIQVIIDKIAIQSSSLRLMKNRIKNLQNIFSIKFIISINMNADRILTAIKMVCIVYVFHGSLPFGVVYVDVLGSRYFVELKVFSENFVTSVARRIISDHSEVVAIVLSKYGVERILDTKIGIVFKAGRYDAHR